jgi:pilus assembly protein CpaB
MNRTQTFLALLASLFVGVGSVFYASQALEAANAQPTTTVIIAQQDIGIGVKISPEMISTVDWPLSAPLTGRLNDASAVAGRVTAAPLIAGEPILSHRLAPEGSRSGFSGRIAPGKRAFTIKVNEVVGVAGFAIPGTYVDVLVTLHDLPGAMKSQGPQSKIVLERLLVLAAAQEHVVPEDNKPKIVGAVTLEVRPDEAETLDLARSVGSLSLALRNPTDIESNPTQGARLGDVLAGFAPTKPDPPKTSQVRRQSTPPVQVPLTVEIYRGVERTTLRQL